MREAQRKGIAASALVRYRWTRWQHCTACSEFIINISCSPQIQRVPIHVIDDSKIFQIQILTFFLEIIQIRRRLLRKFYRIVFYDCNISCHYTHLITVFFTEAARLPFHDQHAVLIHFLNEKGRTLSTCNEYVRLLWDASRIHVCYLRIDV